MCASQGWGRKEARVKFVVVEGLLAIRAPSRQPYSDPRAHRPWRPPTRTCRQRRVCKCVRRARSGEAQGCSLPGDRSRVRPTSKTSKPLPVSGSPNRGRGSLFRGLPAQRRARSRSVPSRHSDLFQDSLLRPCAGKRRPDICPVLRASSPNSNTIRISSC